MQKLRPACSSCKVCAQEFVQIFLEFVQVFLEFP